MVNLKEETFEGDTRRHYKETRGRRQADTLERDMGTEKTLEDIERRYWKETHKSIWKHCGGNTSGKIVEMILEHGEW